jgi:hypothetical protein
MFPVVDLALAAKLTFLLLIELESTLFPLIDCAAATFRDPVLFAEADLLSYVTFLSLSFYLLIISFSSSILAFS